MVCQVSLCLVALKSHVVDDPWVLSTSFFWILAISLGEVNFSRTWIVLFGICVFICLLPMGLVTWGMPSDFEMCFAFIDFWVCCGQLSSICCNWCFLLAWWRGSSLIPLSSIGISLKCIWCGAVWDRPPWVRLRGTRSVWTILTGRVGGMYRFAYCPYCLHVCTPVATFGSSWGAEAIGILVVRGVLGDQTRVRVVPDPFSCAGFCWFFGHINICEGKSCEIFDD